jgi:hypothetical protein
MEKPSRQRSHSANRTDEPPSNKAGQIHWPNSEKVLVSERVIAATGLAKDVEAVSQYAAVV